MRRSLPWLAVLLVGGLLGPVESVHAGVKVRGPMVGHVTSSTALIWMYAGARAKVIIEYRRESDPPASAKKVTMPPYTTGPGTCRVKLEGLAPSAKYVFTTRVNGKMEEHRKGRFTTAPVEGTPAKFRVAVTSCMDPEHETHAGIRTLSKQESDLCLLLGDNVYSDSTNRGVIWHDHLSMRGISAFADVIRHTPTLAVWDDHDFANNDSDGTAPGKENSLIAFQELFPNPSFGLPDVPGVFFSFRWANVEFFMLDVRYHRSPNDAQDGPRKTMLGKGQFRWLVDALRSSRATFKVLASGSTLDEVEEDCWSSFDRELRELYRAIARHGITGVVFLSGDKHVSSVRVHPKASTGFYDLTEVISSGIAVGGPNNFATLDFDTTITDPTIRIRIVEREGRVSSEHIVRRSALE